MQTVKILCVGKLKEAYWRQACAEYEKRLQSLCRFSIVELPESRLPQAPSQSEIDRALQAEGKLLLEAAANSYRIALCIEGQALTSVGLSDLLQKTGVMGEGSLSFIIGSSFGLSEQVKLSANKRISMSEMTFPHQLARVMLCEQIYRAYSIAAGTKYHK